MVYGPLESESQAVIRGMDMCGQSDFARRGLEFFLKRYNAQGFLTTGYTMVGTGEHLWTLAEHQRPLRRSAVARAGIAPQLVRACKWIARQRAKTKRLDARRQQSARVRPDAAGRDGRLGTLRLSVLTTTPNTATAWRRSRKNWPRSGIPTRRRCWPTRRQYRDDLLRAYRWTQARCPVVALQQRHVGAESSGDARHLRQCRGDDARRRRGRTWCYSVEIGSHHLAANRPARSAISDEVARMMDYLEDHQFLRSGWCDYPERAEPQRRLQSRRLCQGSAVLRPERGNLRHARRREAVPPLLLQHAECAAQRGEPFALGAFPQHGARGTRPTRRAGSSARRPLMFAMDRGDELWLAPMVTNRWLEDGKKIEVRNAPTPIRHGELLDHLGGGRRTYRRRDRAADSRNAQASGDSRATSRGETDPFRHGQRQAAPGFDRSQRVHQHPADQRAKSRMRVEY